MRRAQEKMDQAGSAQRKVEMKMKAADQRLLQSCKPGSLNGRSHHSYRIRQRREFVSTRTVVDPENAGAEEDHMKK
jgi:hypothetical protein